MKQDKTATPKLEFPLDLIGPSLSSFAGIHPRKTVECETKRRVVSLVRSLKKQHGIPVKRTLQSLRLQPSRFYRWEKMVTPPQPTKVRAKTKILTSDEEVVFRNAAQKYPYADASRFRFTLSREFGLDLNPRQLKALREKHGLKANTEAEQSLHTKVLRSSVEPQDHPVLLRYLCFLRIDGVDADFPLCVFIDAQTQAVVHWELGMEWPRVLACGNTFETYKKYQDQPNPPKIVGTNEYWHLANEFIRCLVSQGVHHQQTWSYEHALHRRTGKQAGWIILTTVRDTLRKNISGFKERFGALVEDYNSFWPIAGQGYRPPNAI